jgi:DNA-binding NarL/FixJ family response regulator
MSNFYTDQERAAERGLSKREQEVLVLAAEGLHSRAIGRELGISDSTVRSHLASLAHKLGARSAVQLGARAVLIGLLEVEPNHRRDN